MNIIIIYYKLTKYTNRNLKLKAHKNSKIKVCLARQSQIALGIPKHSFHTLIYCAQVLLRWYL